MDGADTATRVLKAMDDLNDLKEQISVLRFETGFLRGLLAAARAVRESETLDEARAKIPLIEIPKREA